MTTSNRVENSTQWLETTLLIIEFFAEKGDVVNAEEFEELTKTKYTRDALVLNILIKAYVKANNPNLLRRIF